MYSDCSKLSCNTEQDFFSFFFLCKFQWVNSLFMRVQKVQTKNARMHRRCDSSLFTHDVRYLFHAILLLRLYGGTCMATLCHGAYLVQNSCQMINKTIQSD